MRWISSTRRLIYRSQTAASEFAAAQIAVHNPADNSVIVVNDIILLSRTLASPPAGWREETAGDPVLGR